MKLTDHIVTIMNQEPKSTDTTIKQEAKQPSKADAKNEVLTKLAARRKAVPAFGKKDESL